MGRSTVSVQPGIGNDSGDRLPGPKRLSTFRQDRCPEVTIISKHRLNVSCAENGTTNWYCRKPFGP